MTFASLVCSFVVCFALIHLNVFIFSKSIMSPSVEIRSFLFLEPLVEFYTMRIHAEATYVMHRIATTYIPPEAMNVFPLVHLMEIFEHVKVKVQQTVTQIRRVKVQASSSPNVPLSWLRPSFKKPRLCQIVDGQ